MIFVDTNYFLRFLLKDEQNHYLEAKNFFEQADEKNLDLISSTVVFFEVFWVARSFYQKNKDSLLQLMSNLLKLGVIFENQNLLHQSLMLFRQLNLSLIDCYNLSFAKNHRVKDFKTFDHKLIQKFKSKN